jgi:hypothetical protein
MAQETVTVALKHPNGLLLRLHQPVEVNVPVLGGGTRTEKQYHPTGDVVRLNGNAHPQDKAPSSPQVEGFALTVVPKDFWDAWRAQNADHPMIKSGLLIAHEKEANTNAEARAKKDLKSGLERLDPEHLPRGLQKAEVAA